MEGSSPAPSYCISCRVGYEFSNMVAPFCTCLSLSLAWFCHQGSFKPARNLLFPVCDGDRIFISLFKNFNLQYLYLDAMVNEGDRDIIFAVL